MSEWNTGSTVNFTYDPESPPQLTPEQKQRLDSMRDEDVDCSDIPPQMGLRHWSRPGLSIGSAAAKDRNASKQRLLLLDEKVLEFFQQSCDDAPAKMNAVLLEYVEAHQKRA